MAALTRTQYEPLFAKVPSYKSSAIVRSFVADINGHPRTLVEVIDILLHWQFEDPSRQDLLEELPCRVGREVNDFGVPASVMVSALLQRKVSMNELTAPHGLPYSYFVAMVQCCLFQAHISFYQTRILFSRSRLVMVFEVCVALFIASHVNRQGIVHRSPATCELLDQPFVPRLSSVILHSMLKSLARWRIVTPDIDITLGHILNLEWNFDWRVWRLFFAKHLALVTKVRAYAGIESVTVGDMFPRAAVLDSSVLQTRIPTVIRQVTHVREHMTPRRSQAVQFANAIVVQSDTNPGFSVAMPFGANEWLLVQAIYSKKNATAITARDVLRKYCSIEDRQTKLPGMFVCRSLLVAALCDDSFLFDS